MQAAGAFELTDLLGQELLGTLREGLASGEAPSAEAAHLLHLMLAHYAIAWGILTMSVALTGSTAPCANQSSMQRPLIC